MEVSRVDEIDPAKEITGKIVSLHGDPRFDFSFGSFDFENLIMIESKEAFAKPGDSGALVVGREDPDHVFKVTALVIGGSRRPDKNDQMFYTYACSFDACLEELEKTLPGQYTSIPASTLPPNVGSTSQSGPNKKIGLVFTLPRSLAAASPHEDRP